MLSCMEKLRRKDGVPHSTCPRGARSSQARRPPHQQKFDVGHFPAGKSCMSPTRLSLRSNCSSFSVAELPGQSALKHRYMAACCMLLDSRRAFDTVLDLLSYFMQSCPLVSKWPLCFEAWFRLGVGIPAVLVLRSQAAWSIPRFRAGLGRTRKAVA